MNKSRLLPILAAMISISATGDTIDWDPQGSGSWADESRWIGRRVPGGGDMARISNKATAVLSDDDWATLDGITSLFIDEGAMLYCDIEQNHSYTGKLFGGGAIVKRGNSKLSLGTTYTGSASAVSYNGLLAVSNGILHVQTMNDRIGDRAWPVVSVAAGCTFSIGKSAHFANTKSAYFQGIYGDGTVSNACGELLQLSLMGGRYKASPTPTWVFGGDLAGTFYIQINATGGWDSSSEIQGKPVHQVFTNPAMDYNNGALRFYAGDISVVRIGCGTKEDPGSLGWAATPLVQFYGENPGSTSFLRYLGEGETVTGRLFRVFNSSANCLHGLDAGPHGNLIIKSELNHYPYSFSAASGTITRFVLEGSNSAPCRLDGVISEKYADQGLSFVKRGSGTWVFGAGKTRGNRAPIMVEQGVLGYESIAEAGKACSLGTATMLSTNYFASSSDTSVPWAYRIGDGRTDESVADLATFAYSGASRGTCTTRPIAIMGAGRLCDTGAGDLAYENVFSCGDGTSTLVLGGTLTNSCTAVTNGTGNLRVVKEGSGEWRLCSPVALGGGVKVKAGRLCFANRFTWYKFTIRQTWAAMLESTSAKHPMFTGFGLWNDAGDILNPNLVHHAACDGETAGLSCGETAMTLKAGQYKFTYDDRHLTNAFVYVENDARDIGTALTHVGRYKSNGYVIPVNGDEDTHIGFVMRLPPGKGGATKYDIKNRWGPESVNFPYEIMGWSMHGSVDGLNWEELDIVTSNKTPATANNHWFASDSDHHGGFPIRPSRLSPSFAPIPSLEVAAGAAVESECDIEVQALTADPADGCGEIKGFAFADDGTLTLKGRPAAAGETRLGYRFEDCSNVTAIAGWRFVADGRETAAYVVAVDGNGLSIRPRGLRIFLR